MAVAGLGPISSVYAVIGAKQHLRSLADAREINPRIVTDLNSMRRRLSDTYGNIVLTEHGRVPMCREDADDHKGHCFHAHALAFGCEAPVTTLATSYYMRMESFKSLHAALAFAATCDNYLLISPRIDKYNILFGALNTPRQLARLLIATALGCSHLTDWRDYPNRRHAIEHRMRISGALV